MYRPILLKKLLIFYFYIFHREVGGVHCVQGCSFQSVIYFVKHNLKKCLYLNGLNRFAFTLHCVKRVRIRNYSGPHFPAFGQNTERYFVSIRIQSEWGKMPTRITPNTDTFHAVLIISFVTFIKIFRWRNLIWNQQRLLHNKKKFKQNSAVHLEQ